MLVSIHFINSQFIPISFNNKCSQIYYCISKIHLRSLTFHLNSYRLNYLPLSYYRERMVVGNVEISN